MKRWLVILLIVTFLLPYTVYAHKAENDEPRLITETEYALVEAMWQEIVGGTEAKRAANNTTAQEVASAALAHDLYVPDSLKWNGNDQFTFETTVGVTCGYSARLHEIAMQAELLESTDTVETEIISYGYKNSPYAKDVYLIEPYYQIDSNFTQQYQKEAQSIAQATGGTYHLYTKTAATIDAIADAMEQGAVVIFDSHGDTDFARGNDYTTGATTSYILLQTGTGLTTEDYALDGETYHAKYYGSYGSMKYFAVDGTCIANHMEKRAPHSFLWMAICLGMATDGMQAPLREKGVEVVYGYSQSVTFDYDYRWEECFWDEIIAEKTVAEAIAKMKKQVGPWDYYDTYLLIVSAVKYKCAFPIVVSSEDVYPGQGKVDALQTVYSTWTLYTEDDCPHSFVTRYETEPTCTEEGEIKLVCDSCGEITQSEKVDALGHDLTTTTVEPTCTEGGYDQHTCNRCGESFIDNETVALGHDCVTETVAPTCTEGGYDKHTCNRCGESFIDNETVALGHDCVTETVAPTCTEGGYDQHTCNRCGESFIDNETAAKGHTCADGVCEVCGTACACADFNDVGSKSWFHKYVVYVAEKGLMNGVGANKFDPEGSVTRAMLVTILYRNAGQPSVEGLENPFTDVESGKWYHDAIVWAANEQIVNGINATTYAPNESITREQIATILYRHSGQPEVNEEALDYPDAEQISKFARSAMRWAVDSGLINGIGGKLAPTETATRAQLAAMLMRYIEK